MLPSRPMSPRPPAPRPARPAPARRRARRSRSRVPARRRGLASGPDRSPGQDRDRHHGPAEPHPRLRRPRLRHGRRLPGPRRRRHRRVLEPRGPAATCACPRCRSSAVHNSFDARDADGEATLRGHRRSTSPPSPGRSASARCAGAVQLSYQRAISFDGDRRIESQRDIRALERRLGSSHGGFDVVAFGTGLRLSRRAARGAHREPLAERLRPAVSEPSTRPPWRARCREFQLDFRPQRLELQPRPHLLARSRS